MDGNKKDDDIMITWLAATAVTVAYKVVVEKKVANNKDG